MLLDKEQFPSVALQSMNAVHHEEIDLINEIAALVKRKSGGEDVQTTLNSALETFLSHVREHFAPEEALMVKHQFTPYPVHKQEHDRVLNELQGLYDQFKATSNSEALENYIFTVIPGWMAQHVATMDFVTARFLAHYLEE